MNKSSVYKKRAGHKVREWAFLTGALLLLIIAVFITLHQFGVACPLEKGSKTPKIIEPGDMLCDMNGSGADGVLPNLTPDEIKERRETEVEEQILSCFINTDPVFASGKEEGNLEIENPPYNVFPVEVQIFLKGTDEVIYDSGTLLPNQHIYRDKLLKSLKEGTYEAIAHINAYDPETKLWLGRSQREMTITIQS